MEAVMNLIWVLVIELFFLMDITRRFRFLTAAHLIILYIMCSQIVFFFGEALIDNPGPESLLTYLSHVKFGLQAYLIIAAITYSSTLFASQPKRLSTGVALKAMMNAATRFIPYIAVICTAYVTFQLAVIDYRSMIFHPWYGAAPARFDSSVVTGIYKLYSLIAIISAASLPLAARSGSRISFYLITLTTTWLFLYSLSSASRGAAVMVFVFAGSWITVAKRGHLRISLLSGFILIVVLRSALSSRGLGEFGLAALPSIIANGFDFSGDQLRYVIVNLFQGIFVTTDGLTMNANFHPLYAWLSFSPLPSTLDGFNTILRSYEIRHGLYVPMSAISEAYNFGPVLFTLAIVTYWIALRATLFALSKGLISTSLFTSLFLFAVFVQANAYPLRNVFRQFLIVILMVFVAWAVEKYRRKTRGPTSRVRSQKQPSRPVPNPARRIKQSAPDSQTHSWTNI
jgi:hypothetical protein